MSDAPGSKQKAFKVQLHTSGWPCHPTMSAVPNASAMGTRYCPWGQQELPQPCTNLPRTTKGSIRLSWKPVCAYARKEAERIWGGQGCAWHRATHMKVHICFPPKGECPHSCCKPPRNRHCRQVRDQDPRLTGTTWLRRSPFCSPA